ncbi:hypothetical protein [Microbacterium sp. BG28]|jgi:hypothetical protein|uniref:hypothetical protein n=1 Tax=Microbacterium sp. BG28 TaxID=3097356 RepID=UPI00278E02E2|nr:hypothetical protein [Microbacterium sp. BG28]MDQ1205046.1 hypothetical protein [Microbacterium sp. SORGH_AS_0862]
MAGVRSGRPWQTVRQVVFAEETHCHICKQLVDKSLPYRDARTGKVNPQSKSVHHLDPHPTKETVAIRSRLRLAHVGCNSSFGDGSRVRTRTSRRW